MFVRVLEHGKDPFEGIVGRSPNVHREGIVAVGEGRHVAGGEEDVAGLPLMARSRLHLKSRQRGVREELHVGHQRGDRLAFAVMAQIAQANVEALRLARQQSHRGMAIVVVALGLRGPHPGQLLLGFRRLIGAGAEQHQRLAEQVVLQQQSQSDRRAVFERQQAGDVPVTV